MILCSDYFIAPTSPSFFSIQAIDNLQTVFSNWLSLLDNFHKAIGLNGLSFKVKFLGVVVQMAKRYKSSGSTAATRWIGEVNTSISRFVSWASMSKKFVITNEEFAKIFKNTGANGYKSQPFLIEKCCDFTPTLKSIAEHFGVPVIYLTQDLCKQYVEEHNKKVREYNKTIEAGEHKMKILGTIPNISDESKQQQYTKSFDSISISYKKIAADLLNL
jgi:vacuolar-type H+-ATPase subunit F/Vma7